MVDFRFQLPPPPLSREGGGAYVRALAAALTARGHGVATEGAGSPGAIRVIDGAALAHCTPEEAAGAVGLVHHTTPLASPEMQQGIAAAERERLALLRRVVATSEAVRDRLLAEFVVDAGRVAVVRPGVPDAPRSAGSSGPECAVLSVGALVPRKGHAVLIRALARLPDLPWWLTIVGDNERDPAHAASLGALATEAGVADRIRFAGTLDEPDLEALWQGADIFALATEWEGYAAAVAEALRRGLPVAVAQGGAAAELVTPEIGVVVSPGDADGLSKAIRRVIFDRPLRADMAAAAWRAGQELPDWPTQASRFVEAVTT